VRTTITCKANTLLPRSGVSPPPERECPPSSLRYVGQMASLARLGRGRPRGLMASRRAWRGEAAWLEHLSQQAWGFGGEAVERTQAWAAGTRVKRQGVGYPRGRDGKRVEGLTNGNRKEPTASTPREPPKLLSTCATTTSPATELAGNRFPTLSGRT
jgi:hypothetical protein